MRQRRTSWYWTFGLGTLQHQDSLPSKRNIPLQPPAHAIGGARDRIVESKPGKVSAELVAVTLEIPVGADRPLPLAVGCPRRVGIHMGDPTNHLQRLGPARHEARGKDSPL